MKHIRQSRKALKPVWHLLRPKPWTWTGNKVFNRTKGERFAQLALHLDDDQFRAFCSALGFVEVNWAFYESQMDRWVQIAYVKLKFRFGGSEAPTAYSRKYAYLKEAFSKNRQLSPFKDRALEVLEDGYTLSEMRHDLTHGVITGVEPVNFFEFELVNRKLLRSGMHKSKEVTFDIRGFPKLGGDLVRLGAKAVQLTAELGDRFL